MRVWTPTAAEPCERDWAAVTAENERAEAEDDDDAGALLHFLLRRMAEGRFAALVRAHHREDEEPPSD